MADFLIACPNCGAQYDGSRVRPGTKVRCRRCKTVFEAAASRTSVARAPDELAGRTIGGYQVMQKIGVGGIGAVYKARQVSLDRIVAFKTLRPEFAQNQSFITRLTREARAAARISHANIVQTYDVGHDQGVSFIAMEFVQGETLHEKVAREGRIDVEFAVKVLEESAGALAFAHEAGIVHRDIKPDNLMIAKDGTVKISDFGLAKRMDVDVSLTQSGTIVGTPRYMSPEQGNGQPLDIRSDIYSLGASVYHALAGVPPFDAPTAMAVIVKHINDPLPPLRKQNPLVPPKLAAVVERMMAKDPANRYQTPAELLDAVRDVRATLAADMAAVASGKVEEDTVAVGAVDVATRTVAAEAVPSVKGRGRWRWARAVLLAVLVLFLIGFASAVQKARRVRRLGEEIKKDFESRLAVAQECHNEERFQDAINVFDGFPPENAPNIERWLQKATEERSRYLGFAEKKSEAEARKAQEAVEKGEFTQARSIYQNILDNFGVHSILEETRKQLADVEKKQEAEISKELSKLEKQLAARPSNPGTAQELYSSIRVAKGDAELSKELEDRLAKVGKQIEKQRGGPKVLLVSKRDKGAYRSVSEAIRNVFGGDIIEIRDSATYEEPVMSSHVSGVTIRGAAGCMPVIRPRDQEQGRMKGGRLAELFSALMRAPSIRVPGDWTLENLVIDFSESAGGIHLYEGGELALRSCAVVNIGSYGIAVGAKGPGSEGMNNASLKISDCVLAASLDRPYREPPRLILISFVLDQRIDLEFSHNVVYGGVAFTLRGAGAPDSKVLVDSSIFEGVDMVAWSGGPPAHVPDAAFDYNCYSNLCKEFFVSAAMDFMRRPPRLVPGKTISTFEEWQKETGGDEHSIHAAANLAAPEKGDFSLLPNSPCIGKGRDGSNIGLLSPRVLPAELFAHEPAREGEAEGLAPEPPARMALDQQREKVDGLILEQRYDEAESLLKANGEDGGAWIANIKLLKALKELVVQTINGGKTPPLPSSFCSDKYSQFAGGAIASANDDSFTAVDKTKKKKAAVKWSELSPDQFFDVARKCTSITDGHEQLMLGVYCFETRLTDKSRTYLGYAKQSKNISAGDKERAEYILQMIEKMGGKPTEAAPAPKENPPPPPPRQAEAFRQIEECFAEGRVRDALLQVEALVKASPDDTGLKYRLAFLLWEHFLDAWESKKPMQKDDYARLWDTTYFLLEGALKEGGRFQGSQKARKVVQEMKEMSRDGGDEGSKGQRREPREKNANKAEQKQE